MTTNKHLMLAWLCVFVGAMNALQTNHSAVARGVWVAAIFGIVISSALANEEAEAVLKSRETQAAAEPAKGDYIGESR